jgi:hypothetical protein
MGKEPANVEKQWFEPIAAKNVDKSIQKAAKLDAEGIEKDAASKSPQVGTPMEEEKIEGPGTKLATKSTEGSKNEAIKPIVNGHEAGA